jgi:hypothetical protein
VQVKTVSFTFIWACALVAGIPGNVWPCRAETVVINVFNEPGAGSVNSYWLAVPAGVVVIDAQRSWLKNGISKR